MSLIKAYEALLLWTQKRKKLEQQLRNKRYALLKNLLEDGIIVLQ